MGIVETTSFQSQESAPLGIKKVLQKGTFVILLEKGRGRTPGPLVACLR